MRSAIYILYAFLCVFVGQTFAQNSVPLRCTLPLDAGNGKAIITQYYYDTTANKCKPFNYSGSGGNVNRFRNMELCKRTCYGTATFGETSPSDTSNAVPAHCALNADSGPCRALMPRFYFDAVSGTCKSFTYGGCQGNKNNFISQESCQNSCGSN